MFDRELNFVAIDTIVEDLEIDPMPYPSINNLPQLLQDIASSGQSLITHTGNFSSFYFHF